MNKKSMNENLNQLVGTVIKKVEKESDSISIIFSDNTKVTACYWRIVGEGIRISSFDQNQKYGLKNEINAVGEIEKIISGVKLKMATFEKDTGDIEFIFGDKKLRLFNFSGQEVWEISFPDGTGEYSNYV